MKKKINVEDYLKRLKECDRYDTECAHGRADEILCELLRELGYSDIVDAYEDIDKWYA